jgi:hypothetical protein
MGIDHLVMWLRIKQTAGSLLDVGSWAVPQRGLEAAV